jgi:cell division protein FtsA
MSARANGRDIFTGLDVGTTKICCIIGQRDEDGRSVRILGMGTHPSHGLKRGMVTDLEKTVNALQQAVHNARTMANTEVHNVYVGIAGEHISCQNVEAEIEIANPERGVTEADREKVIEKARQASVPFDREIIQCIPQEFICDTQGGIRNPLNVCCAKLGARVHIITAAVAAAQTIVRCVNQAGLRTCDVVLQSLASSMAVLDEEMKDLGCALIDIGGGTTDISVFSENAIRYSGVIPEGGDNVTRDIMYGLKISQYDAENIKKRLGHALMHDVDPEETFEVTAVLRKERARAKRRELAEIIEARLEEILVKARDLLEGENVLDRLHAGIVLTGGTSLTAGLQALAERVFNMPVAIGQPSGLKGMSGQIASPIYATGVGLVEYGITHDRDLNLKDSNLFQKLKRIFRGFIDFY